MFNKIASTFFIKTVIAFINLAIVVALSQLIGAEGKGEATIILTSIAMLLLVTNIIGGPSLIYFIPRYNALFLFFVSNLWSAIICCLAYFLLDYFQFIPHEFIFPVVVLALLNSLLSTNTCILYGKEKITSANFIFLLQALINILILLLLINTYDQKSVFSYIYSLYAAFGLCFIISLIMIMKYLKKIDFTDSKKIFFELLKLGFINQLGHFLKFMSFRFIYYIIVNYSIDIYTGKKLLGIFSNGNSLTEAILLITNSYISVIHPRISNSTDINYSRQLTLKYTKHSIILCSIALVILMLIPESFWIWLFGKDFEGLRNIVLLLCPGIFFYNIGLIVGHYFSGIGKPQISTIGNLVGLITTFVLILLVLPKFDLLDISIISSLSYFTTTLIIIIYFLKETKLKLKNIFPTLSDMKDLKNDIFLLVKK